MRWLALCLCLILPATLHAQTSEEDRGFIQGLLEDALSGEGRSVRIEGFAGALSSRATIERITVSDPDGVWLTMTDLALQWRRAALLRGRIEIDEISVGRIALPRQPVPGPGAPAPEARGAFSLPELPVSIRIADLDVARVALGAPLFGEEAALSLSGEAELADGAGSVRILSERLDAGGDFALSGAYDNATRDLSLALQLQEPANGIAVRLLGLPGQPSLALRVEGDGPVDDFEARLGLDTGGQERLSGRVTLRGEGEDADSGLGFRLEVSGDLAPVFAPQYASFLGDEVQLLADGQQQADGALLLESLRISANALLLEGSAAIGADGWPRRFALQGEIAPAEGESVLLPVPGAETRVGRVVLDAGFDASQGDAWTLEAALGGLQGNGFAIDRITLDGQGGIAREAERVTGSLNLVSDGIDAGDAALNPAIGDRIRGALDFAWSANAPLRISGLDLSGADYGLAGALTVDGPGTGGSLAIRPDLTLRAEALDRFGPLASLDALAGAADLSVIGRVEPLTGIVALTLDGTTRGLATGLAQIDPLLAGAGELRLAVTRDEAGTRVKPLRIATQAARIEGSADLATGDSSAVLEARIFDTGAVFDGVTGPAELTLRADQQGERWDIDLQGTLPGDARVTFDGAVDGDGRQRLRAEGRLTAAVGALGPYSALAGRTLGGSLDLSADGSADLLSGRFDIAARGETRSPRVGVPVAERLLAGTTQFALAAERDASGVLRVDRLGVTGPNIAANGTAQIGAEGDRIGFDLRLPDTGAVLVGVTGAAALDGEARREGDTWTLDLDGSGPGGATLSLDGRIEGYGTQVQTASGSLEATVARLSAFSAAAGRGLSGALDLSASGTGNLTEGSFSVEARGATRALGIAVPAVEPLLRGETRFALALDRTASGTLRVERATLDGAGVGADLSGSLGGGEDALSFDARLPDLGLVAPDFPGPASVTGTARRNGGPWRLDASATGPGGIALSADGTVAPDASSVALSLDGAAPLSIVNGFLRDQALSGTADFDLAVNGPPRLGSVTGVLRTQDARFAFPAQRIAVEGLSGAVRLSGGQAQVDLSGRLDPGGEISLAGPIAVSPPFDADLVIALRNAELRRPPLLQTVANGTATVTGPLIGGALIGGEIGLETVEIRIASLGPSYAVLDGLRHVVPPPDVQRTLRFAGLVREEAAERVGPAFGIDLTISAPNRVFVRGRGVDAELGGELRLTGTTDDVVPVGRFDLLRGRIDLLGQRLTLSEASVALRGNFEPFVVFAATTQVDDTTVAIRLEGPASAPELIVTSSPELPQDEALSLLLFGRSVSDISALQAVRLASAVRTLSGRGGLGLTDQLRSGLGVDDLDLGTDEQGNLEARVGAYLSENIYTDVTVNTEGESQINLNLDVSPNVTVRGRLGSGGDSGIGVYYERDY